MDNLNTPLNIMLSEPNKYDYNIELYCKILSFLPFLEEATEDDYIKYHNDNTFEYSPHFYSFIRTVFDSKMVEDPKEMTAFLTKYNSPKAYSLWIKDMNKVLSDSALCDKINISFIRKAFFTMIKLEKIMPGSWGIDVETGNWLKLLKALQRILPQVYKCDKGEMN